MNKVQLVTKVAEASGLTKKDAEKAVTALFGSPTTTGIIMDTVTGGEVIQLIGFGTFTSHIFGERAGRNPQTGEEITISAKNRPKFNPSKRFKELMPAPKTEAKKTKKKASKKK